MRTKSMAIIALISNISALKLQGQIDEGETDPFSHEIEDSGLDDEMLIQTESTTGIDLATYLERKHHHHKHHSSEENEASEASQTLKKSLTANSDDQKFQSLNQAKSKDNFDE